MIRSTSLTAPASSVGLRVDCSWLAPALLAISAAVGVGCDSSASPSSGATGTLSIEVAPLNLAGVGDAEYTVRVSNAGGGAGQVIWEKSGLLSTRYGDGAGSLTVVGPCDADTGIGSVTVTLDGLYDGGGALISETSYQDPTPISRDVTCARNADARVTFDLTIVRAAAQGFFDIGVSFDDIFCSAKLDCVRHGTSDPLELLFDAAGARRMTAVLGFACTASTTTAGSTYLYMNDPVISCMGDAPFDEAVTFDASAAGRVDLAATSSRNPGGYLFAAAVYRGTEQLASKAYWNIAFGLNDQVFTAARACRLTLRATASAEQFATTPAGFVLPADEVYPVVEWNVLLSDAAGRACETHAVNDGTGVATTYVGYLGAPNQFSWSATPTYLQHEYDAASQTVRSVSGGACVPACANGVCDGDVCSCTDGYWGPACASACPGGAGALACGGNGTCDDGAAGSGACACLAGFAGDGCEACESGRFGADCAPCACVNGRCDEGRSGDGSCTCDTGWAGIACDTCASGFFGAECAPCTCVHGACADGPTGDGACTCEAGWVGPACDGELTVLPVAAPGFTQGSNPRFPVAMNGVTYFSADDGVHGTELWRTDGTAAGTVLVKDIYPGTAAGDPAGTIVVGDTLYFAANDGVHGTELWQSDGTEPGTLLVVDSVSGSTAGLPSYYPDVRIVAAGGRVFFKGADARLWVTDGTESGARSLGFMYGDVVAMGDALYFSGNDGTHGGELWKTDGTEAGTVMVADLYPGGSGGVYSPSYFTVVGGDMLYFRATDGTHHYELWRSDGTAAGTVMVKDINPGSGSSYPSEFTAVGEHLFFFADDGLHGHELWVSDGSDAGTRLVADLVPGTASSGTTAAVGMDGILYFNGPTPDYDRELWRSDGTEVGTFRVKDINSSGSGYPSRLLVSGGTLFFLANDGVAGAGIWQSDGTEPGTLQVAPGPLQMNHPLATDGGFYFSNNDGVHGAELWKCDGTTAGTSLFVDLNVGPFAANPSSLTAAGDTLLFTANDGLHGIEIFASDGTVAGTSLVADLAPGASSSNPTSMSGSGGTYWRLDDSVHGAELWRTDGTGAGTELVRDISPGAASGVGDTGAPLAGAYLFIATDGVNGAEVWKTDGTDVGTVLVKDAREGSAGSTPNLLVSTGERVFFVARVDGIHPNLWTSDGTSSGTHLVRDINPGGYTYVDVLTAVGSNLFFRADDGSHGSELWVSDGTEAGTTMVADIWVGGQAIPLGLIAVDGWLYFSASDGVLGRELWRNDGTAAGTMLVKDINPGPAASNPLPMAALGGSLYFVASDGTTINRLWKTDGTTAGTVMVADVAVSVWAQTVPSTVLGDRVYFGADDGVHGVELWASDGTAEGTSMLVDLSVGSLGSAPDNFLAVGDAVYFRASGPASLAQLWRYVPAP